jgi:predicted nucleotidyltransferase
METPVNKLNKEKQQFLQNLKTYIDEPIYYFGSVNRLDYTPNSDIDMAIFTNNIESLVLKIQVFLKVKREDIQKIIVQMGNDSLHGYKVKYETNDINLEIVMYDEIYKPVLLPYYYKTNHIPYIISILLLIMKQLNAVNLFPSRLYYKIKGFLFTYVLGFNNKLIVVN